MPLAKRATALAPWNAANFDTLAAAFAGLGRCAEAVQTQSHAVDLLSERLTPEGQKPYLDHPAELWAGLPARGNPISEVMHRFTGGGTRVLTSEAGNAKRRQKGSSATCRF